MRLVIVVVLLLLASLRPLQAATPCVPVEVEAPLRPPRPSAKTTTPGCVDYRRVPRSAGGERARILVLGDPQVKSMVDVDYFRRDIIDPLREAGPFQLGVVLGDLVDDVPALWPEVQAATASLDMPWLFAPGNHDVDPHATSDADALKGFVHAFGADTRARQAALFNLVALDNVISTPGVRPAYTGGFREDQFAFLERWLPTLERSRLLVLAMHIPLFEEPGRDTFRDGDRERLFALLRPFPHVLLLSAHTHTQRHVFHDAASGWHGGRPLHEFNVGAACGAFWSGASDAAGIPDATMADGTPNGHALLTVRRGGDYALAWFNARDPHNAAIGLHAPKVLRRGAYPAWGVYANVYMGMDDSRVEYRIDGGAWRPMRKVLQPDPRLMAENRRDDEATALRGYDRSPEAEPSPHLWRGALPTDLAAGEHMVEVRAFDRWQGEQRASTTYRLDDATP